MSGGVDEAGGRADRRAAPPRPPQRHRAPPPQQKEHEVSLEDFFSLSNFILCNFLIVNILSLQVGSNIITLPSVVLNCEDRRRDDQKSFINIRKNTTKKVIATRLADVTHPQKGSLTFRETQ